jgi:cellulose synthase/poly-beta-1,6-N-acetylglucosamine synthase-like glycosyltransferase
MAGTPRRAKANAPLGGSGDVLVSVVIPARNEEVFIGACLESVLAQDETNLEVLVVDGGSTEQTAGTVRAYAEGDPRVHLIENPGATIPRSLNAAVAAARGRLAGAPGRAVDHPFQLRAHRGRTSGHRGERTGSG